MSDYIGMSFDEIVAKNIDKVCDPKWYDDISEAAESADLDGRYRVFEFILYDDSLVPDWIDFLSSLHIQCYAIHHDRDVWTVPGKDHQVGDLKKAHWHVWMNFPGKKKGMTVLQFAARCGGVRLQEKQSALGSCRYLTHMDEDPALKYHYPASDVLCLGGSQDYMEYCMSKSDGILEICSDMTSYILENDVTSFIEFADYCRKNNKMWFDVLSSKRSLYFITTIKSNAYKVREEIGHDS